MWYSSHFIEVQVKVEKLNDNSTKKKKKPCPASNEESKIWTQLLWFDNLYFQCFIVLSLLIILVFAKVSKSFVETIKKYFLVQWILATSFCIIPSVYS